MARQKIKDGFIAKDANNLLNIEPDGETHSCYMYPYLDKTPSV
jgi:hypothetical protein